MKQAQQLYSKLCTEYNDKGYERICSLQTFLESKYNKEKNVDKKALLYDVIQIASNDYAY